MIKEEMLSLVKEAKDGSQKAFSILYKTLYNQIYNHILYLVKKKELAEDLTSEAFAKAFVRIHKFQDEISFLMWPKTIAVNCVIDEMRRKHMNVINEAIDKGDENFEFTSEFDLSPEDKYIQMETREVVEKNIDSLSPRAKQVVSHRYIDGLSYKEIAEKMGLSIGTIKSYISKSTNKIKPKN
jgi:RNA polymerase sigma-70 factor (ECF subfamily)